MDVAQKTWWVRLRSVLVALGPFLGLAILFIGLWIAIGDNFVTGRNLRTMARDTVVVGIGAVGMTLIIITAGIDLSVGSVIALASVLGAKLLSLEAHPFFAVIAAIGIGAVVGLANGALITFAKLPSFIATLGMMQVSRGVAKIIGDNQTVNYDISHSVNGLMKAWPYKHYGDWLPEWLAPFVLAHAVWVTIFLALSMAFILGKTTFGRHAFAIGSNEAAARLCGIQVTKKLLLIYTLAGACFGLAGLFQMAQLRQGDPTSAMGLELDVIAAVVIGGASLSGGVGSIAGALAGALIMTVLRNGFTQLHLPSAWQEVTIGVVVLLAVIIDQIRRGSWWANFWRSRQRKRANSSETGPAPKE